MTMLRVHSALGVTASSLGKVVHLCAACARECLCVVSVVKLKRVKGPEI